MKNKEIHLENYEMTLLVDYLFNSQLSNRQDLTDILFRFELTQSEYFNLVVAVNKNRVMLEAYADNALNPLLLRVDGVICTSNNRYFLTVDYLKTLSLGYTFNVNDTENRYVFEYRFGLDMNDDDSLTLYRHLNDWRHLIENQNDKHMDEGKKTQDNGAFLDSLKRNNKQIRDDRAQAIGEDAEMIYKRKIEDMEITIKRMVRDQDNMLDMSPDNAQSLKLASDFNAEEFATKDIELGKNIRNLQIVLNIAKKRYNYLFGHRYAIE